MNGVTIAGMESIDAHILSLLARDGRMSYTDIGRATGLSTSAAQQRVRRLEKRGVITGYHAEIDPVTLGRTLLAFIAVRPLRATLDESLPAQLQAMPEIVSCFAVAGDASYLCMVEVAGTAELEALLNRMRNAAGLITITTVVLSTLFRDRPLIDPVPAEEQD